MSENFFIREEASLSLIHNVTSFCSECYNELQENETIYYDMKHYRYLCQDCKEQVLGSKVCEQRAEWDQSGSLFK